eukprot:CAMPEP_0184746790 /NCGR_PEP_ID=MMETSP0315-20130426/9315_1 /TAXON_ID=101924 /ORGANISM="Rhodosorus marinus, Strain UTEX LB 2760" /LENGTH=134 /DNA_ID=CAMNT_0027219527 /DNA_START=75 /DNA_END=479 /DNA_ORIENTATION=-
MKSEWSFDAEELEWLEQQAEEHNMGSVWKTLGDILSFYEGLDAEHFLRYVEDMNEVASCLCFDTCLFQLRWLETVADQVSGGDRSVALRALIRHAMNDIDVDELFETTRVARNTNELYCQMACPRLLNFVLASS